MDFDLPGQLVADRPGAFDLAPHARTDLKLFREDLFEPLGWQTLSNGLLKKSAVQRKGVRPAGDGDVCHKKNTDKKRLSKLLTRV